MLKRGSQLSRAARWIFRFVVGCAAFVAPQVDVFSNELDFFERKVRPLLFEKCGECHGPEEPESKLVLTSVSGIASGGSLGPVFVPEKPDESRLIQAVRYTAKLKMPPDTRLSEPEIAILEQWVESGALMPGATIPMRPQREQSNVTAKDRQWWAFQPISDPPLPAVHSEDRVRIPIDRFVLRKLEEHGLRLSSDADRPTLIRRITFNLIGIPPTPEEVDAFVRDQQPEAYERLVDRLLASPQYGVRWGRHWLDVVRYADTNGGGFDYVYPNAWHYRDYVVRAFNEDKPYDQFLVEQLAGDLLPIDCDQDTYVERLKATGLLTLAPKGLGMQDKEQMILDVVDDQIDVLGRSLMGITLSCSRCHDHKFDPIPTEDYYALAGIFYSTQFLADTDRNPSYWPERPLELPHVTVARKEYEARKAANEKAMEEAKGNADTTDERLAELAEEAKSIEQTRVPDPTMAMVAWDASQPVDLRVHVAGNRKILGNVVRRGFPRVIRGRDSPSISVTQSGRLKLARWLTAPEHPLTARVFVNRVWQWHFGEGLVRTTDNFGRLGERPSHPQLLDWLARQLIESGWSVKALHRQILLSSTYRQSSVVRDHASIDSGNRLLWRMNRRRLEAEALRDAMLSVSGQLDLRIGGTVNNWNPKMFSVDDENAETANYDTRRRSVYLPVVRGAAVYETLRLFDFGDPSSITPRRNVTTVAPQALFLMNNAFVIEQAEKLAQRLADGEARDATCRVRLAYRLTLSREPSAAELERAVAFVREAQPDAWRLFCHMLLCLNEFSYVE